MADTESRLEALLQSRGSSLVALLQRYVEQVQPNAAAAAALLRKFVKNSSAESSAESAALALAALDAAVPQSLAVTEEHTGDTLLHAAAQVQGENQKSRISRDERSQFVYLHVLNETRIVADVMSGWRWRRFRVRV